MGMKPAAVGLTATGYGHTMLRFTGEGRAAFEEYRKNMKQVLDDLPAQ